MRTLNLMGKVDHGQICQGVILVSDNFMLNPARLYIEIKD